MKTRSIMAIALAGSVLSACGGLDSTETLTTYASVTSVMGYVSLDIMEEVTATSTELTQKVSTQESTSFDTTLEGDGTYWSGSIDASGTYEYVLDPYSLSWEMDLVYKDVSSSVSSGYVMNGDISWAYSYSGTTFEYSLVGEIEVSGDVSGSLEMDYTYSYSGSSYSCSGTIGDFEFNEDCTLAE